MTDLFTTISDALTACEDAGLEPRTQHGGLGETSYWVYLDGAYSSYWSDAQFLGWANAYFTRRAARLAAGWTFTHGEWFSPCGMPESDWSEESLPFPEDADYAPWASAYYHYEALDNDITGDSIPCTYSLMTKPTFDPERAQRSTHRVSFTAPDSVWQKLVACSNAQGRSISNLVAYLVEHHLEDAPMLSGNSS